MDINTAYAVVATLSVLVVGLLGMATHFAIRVAVLENEKEEASKDSL